MGARAALIGLVAALAFAGSTRAALAAAAPNPSPSPADQPPVAPAPEPQVGNPPGVPPITAPATSAPPRQAKVHLPTDELNLTLLETKDLRLLYFDPAETYLTPYVARAFENSVAFQKQLWGWTPWEKTTVLLKDFGDYGNAGARASPNNAILVDIAPLIQRFETFSPGERFYTLMNHEPVHVATMDVWNRSDAVWRSIFHGKPGAVQEHPETILYNFLATPRVNVPRWYLEGSAVFMETWEAGGYGRAQGGYDEMVFRAMVRDNARFFSPLGLESEGTAIDFQVGVNDYLYGTRFVSYLAETRSPEKVIAWLRRDPGSAAYYSVQFRKIFGESLDDAWRDWIAWEHDFQHANLKEVSQYPLTPLQRLSPRALGSVSRAYIDPKTGDLIAAFRYPGVISHLGVLSLATGKIRRIADIKGTMLYDVTSLAYDPDAGKAYYTTDNYGFRNIVEADLSTGKTRTLISHGRIGGLVVDPKDKSIWGLRHLNGIVTLVKIPPPYSGWTQVHTFPFGRIVFDLDISPDGSLLAASVGEINGSQSEQVFHIEDLSEEDPQPIATLKLDGSTPESFVFSPDGRYLFGSAYYTGVSNIYRFEIATSKVEAVSNTATGLFRPIPRPDGSLVALEYTGQGFTPVAFDPKPLRDLGTITFLGSKVAADHPVVKTWALGSPAKVPLDSMIIAQGPYEPLYTMKLADTWPFIGGYKGEVDIGAHLAFEDPLQFDQLSATLSYTPSGPLSTRERWHADVAFHTVSWSLEYWHNLDGFYDLFGPTELARKGDAVIAGYKRSFIYDPPQEFDFSAEAGEYYGLDTLPGAQNVPAITDRDIGSLRLRLKYLDGARSLGAVEREAGIEWNVAFEPDYSTGGAYPRGRVGLAFGFPLGWAHSSLWLYNAAGVAGGARANPLGAYYLGAFGNNYVDAGEVHRYRNFDSFPGFEIDGIATRAFARSLAELNLPPIRFAEVGKPSLYLSYLRGELFAGGLAEEAQVGGEHTLATLGAQIDLNFTLALRLPMTVSVGYARGFELSSHEDAAAPPPLGIGLRPHGEAMISLKVL